MTSATTPVYVADQPVSGRGRRRAPRAAAVRSLTAALGGLVSFLAFPPVGAWPLAPVGVALLLVALHRRRSRAGLGLGLLYGLTFFVPLLVWIRVIGVDAWLLLAAIQSCYLGGFGAGAARLSRLRGWPLWVACWWVAVEAVRGRVPLGGFPWGRLAFSQAGSPLGRFAALGGAPLASFVVALLAALLALALLATRTPSGRRLRLGAAQAVAVAAAGVALALLGGLAVPLPTAGQHRGGPAYATIAVVQGNVPRMGLDAFAQRYAVMGNHVAATEQLAAEVAQGRRPAPDVVLWPENSTDIDPAHDAVVHDAIARAVADVDRPTLVGAVIDGPGPTHVRNSGLVWLPGQEPTLGYVKRHLVPFGEYIPYRAELGSLIGELRRIPYDMAPGHKSGVVQLGPVRLSDVICYEVAYDGLVRGDVVDGGRLIVVQTNNATYGDSETQQQLAMGRLRAIEHGRAVAVAATSGISAIIAPDGTVLSRSGIFTQAVLEHRVPLRDSLTVADRLGVVPETVLAGLGAAVLLGAVVTGRLRRRRTA